MSDKQVQASLKGTADEQVSITVPPELAKRNVAVRIYDGEKPVKRETFRSFGLSLTSPNTFLVNNKIIHITSLIDLLQKNGLSKTLPIDVRMGTELVIDNFDWKPISYNGPVVWHFDWKGIDCSIAGGQISNGQYRINIRVHDMTPGVGEQVISEISAELLKYWKSPTAANEMTIYISRDIGYGIQWTPLCVKKHRRLDTIYIRPDIKDKLIKQLEKFFQSEDMYDQYGITYKRIHLFHGPPGTGKTSTIMAIASYFGKHLAKFTITPSVNSQKLEFAFQSLPADTFLLLEDVDALFSNRQAQTSIDFSTMLNCLDGITTRKGLVMFMTTNHLMKLDEAFVRPGRVDLSVEFKPPSRRELEEALHMLGSQFSHEHKEFLDRHGEGMTIAHLQKHLFDCIMEEKKSIL
jgi:hypothetical protein